MYHSNIVTGKQWSKTRQDFRSRTCTTDEHPHLASATIIAQTPKTTPEAYQPPATLEPCAASANRQPWPTGRGELGLSRAPPSPTTRLGLPDLPQAARPPPPP